MSSFSDFFSPLPHSCDYCKHLVLYQRDEKWWEKALGNDPDVEAYIDGLLSKRAREWLLTKKVSPLHSDSWLNLRYCAVLDLTFGEARQADCHFCREVIEQCEDLNDQFEDDEFVIATSMGRTIVHFGVLEFGHQHYPSDPIDNNWVWISTRTCGNSYHALSLCDDPASKDIPTRPINVTPSSKISFHQLQEWRQECLKTHKACHEEVESTFMPTRVLEIEEHATGPNGYKLRLKETHEMKTEPYAALSYCWGGPQNGATTKSTYGQYLLEINEQVVPLTIQHAISVARNIGIRYLWVDAFCIYQDDLVEMVREIAQMPQIYNQADVTILASMAERAVDGFLHERPQIREDDPNRRFQLPFRSSENQLGSIVLVLQLEMSTEPLQTRGWAMQEMLLSPRMIEFCAHQTRWKCQKMSKSDGWVSSYYWDNFHPTARLSQPSRSLPSQSEFNFGERRHLFKMWDSLLQDYTSRRLTNGTDRLPAISGIATKMAEILGDEYKAGLWKSDMASQLLWWHSDYRKLLSRPIQYQGPSWSWAAIDGEVILASNKYPAHDDFGVMNFSITHLGESQDDLGGKLSFGAVESGSLRLRGRLEPAECVYVNNIRKAHISRCKTEAESHLFLDAIVFMDALEVEFGTKVETKFGTEIEGPDLACISAFLLAVQTQWNHTNGLILRHIGDCTYSRLGSFKTYSNQILPEDIIGLYSNKESLKPEAAYPEWMWSENSPIESITLI